MRQLALLQVLKHEQAVRANGTALEYMKAHEPLLGTTLIMPACLL